MKGQNLQESHKIPYQRTGTDEVRNYNQNEIQTLKLNWLCAC